MSRVRVAPIVEGHGEVASIRILLQRIWIEIVGGEYTEVLQPIRQKRQKIAKPHELERAVGLAAAKLAASSGQTDRDLILILLDGDNDAACQLGPQLLARARAACGHVDIACVLAVVEYETWFIGAAESLTRFLDFGSEVDKRIANPEEGRLGKGWIEARFAGPGPRYSETLDQPSMTATMDLTLCRQRCPSFDKLCRELEKRRDN